MDDMYQYAASAVDSKNQQQVPEENDVLIKAFNNFGWGKKWSNLVDTMKKQSEAFVEGTKKDLQEFAQVLTEDPEEDEESANREEQTTRSVNDQEEISALDTLRNNLAKINTVNLSSLREGLTETLNQTLPSQIKSVRLPENMDLAQLKEGLTSGTRSAEQYLQKFGTDVMSALKQTVTVLEPEEEQKDEENNYSASQTARIYATRKDALLAKMQDNPATYLEEPSAKDIKVLDTFNSTFHIEEYTDEIAQLLNDYPNLREMMDRLVPVQVSYPLFWQRYFYHAWNIEQDEKKRQLIVQQPNEDDTDFKWDSDEDDNTTVKEDNTKQKQRSSEDTDDFSHISSSAASPPPGKTDDDWVKAEKKPSDEEEEESDSDWE
ncbi:BSD domain-containing protein 1 [Choanephora cucurbitarum]|uniref:BSD domain-containing protein 1 n=1 Tax=Choanephora cucurbitarum TaxID=101091 RepID=A0A1C7N9R1_9FUNG|nr:BSD domain-containing protein 1 [Choanephora cucurbitarum]